MCVSVVVLITYNMELITDSLQTTWSEFIPLSVWLWQAMDAITYYFRYYEQVYNYGTFFIFSILDIGLKKHLLWS